jgi:trehalose 2-sulfotransferase
MPRSGSWLLADALRGTGVAGRPEEYYWDQFYASYLERWGNPRIASYADFLSQTFRVGTTDNGMFAAKLHWAELEHLCASLAGLNGNAGHSHGELIEQHFPAPKIIYLRRCDRVRQALSWYRADRTATWYHVRDEPRRHYEIEPDWSAIHEMELLLRAADRQWRAFFSELGVHPHEVIYEDLVTDYQNVVRGTFAFLELPGASTLAVTAPRLRQQRDELTEIWLRAYLEERRRLWPPADELYGAGLAG